MARTVAMWTFALLFGLLATTIAYVHDAQIGGWFSLGDGWALAGAIVSLLACAMFICLGDPVCRRMPDVGKVSNDPFDRKSITGFVRRVDNWIYRSAYMDQLKPKLPPGFVRIPPSNERVPF
jgi:hypothetical protein